MLTIPSHSVAHTSRSTSSDGWLNGTCHFPAEVIVEILHRLPVKPLLCFRCVSKQWCSLITSPPFVQKHLQRTIECNPDSGIIVIGHQVDKFCLANLYSLDVVTAVEVDDLLKTSLCGAQFVGSCNGLVCLSKNQIDNLLWNPSTRKCTKIPSAPAEFPRSFRSIESSLCGFGYDHNNDDYKVVRIAECYRDQFSATMVIVYSLKTNSWTRVQNIPRHIRFTGNWGMFASGAVHWLAINNPAQASRIIVAFDLGAERYKEVPFPASFPVVVSKSFENLITTNIFVVGGSLCLLQNYPGSRMDVWLMSDYGVETSWSKLFSVEQAGRFVRPVTFSKSRKDVLLEADSKQLVWYNCERKIVKDVVIHGIPDEFDSHVYTESLVQLQKKSAETNERNPKQTKIEIKFLSKGFKLKL